MKKLLFVFLVITVGATSALLYEKIFVGGSFGPTAILATVIGAGASLLILATLMLYETRYREIMTSIWLTGISVTVTYILVDLVAGFFLIESLSPPLVPDEYRHHKLVPNSYARLEMRDFTYIQRVNSLGLRGEDVRVEKNPDTYRILMLGDSFTMGKGVEDNETFPVLLQASLNRRLSACKGRPVEILNAGVDGYAPILSFIQLTRELQPLKPDMIILNLDMNDLVGEAVYRQQAIHGPKGEIIGVLSPEDDTPMEKFRSWTERNLYFTRLLLIYVNEYFGYSDVRSVVTQANFEVLAHTLADDETDRQDQWRDLFDSVMNIKKFADDRGIEFLLTTYPYAHQVNETEGIPGIYGFVPEGAIVSDRSVDIIRKYAADNNIQFVSMFPLFRTYEGEDKLYFHYDTHWTPAGQKVMADGLEEDIVKRYFEDWCGYKPDN